VPVRAALNVDKNQADCLKNGPILNEEWVVNPKTKGVQNVFVWLVPDSDDKGAKLEVHPSLAAAPTKPVEIDQPCCAFEPHVVALREGQKLLVKNSSAIAHNVNCQGGKANTGLNVQIPAGKDYEVKDLKADRLPMIFACNIHPWMKGYLRIFDHPYYAVTDKDGNFEIKLAPVGPARVVVWQEGIGYMGGAAGRSGKPVKLADKETDLGKFEIKPE
jgi:hypothetical protein